MNEIEINGEKYIKKSSIEGNDLAYKKDDMKYCIIRGESSGVFAAYLYSRDKKEVILKNARRIWYWDGAASISQLAIDGVNKPKNCKFPEELQHLELTDVIEIIPTTKKAKDSIDSVPIWRAK